MILLRCQTLPQADDDTIWTEAISLEQTLMTLDKLVASTTISDITARAVLETHLYWMPAQREVLQKIQKSSSGDNPDYAEARALGLHVAQRLNNSWETIMQLKAFH